MENSKKLNQYFDLAPLKMTGQLESFALEDALYKEDLPVPIKNYIFGLEIEVENIRSSLLAPAYRSYWNVTGDNSLRNGGVEYITLPLKAFQIDKALQQLQQRSSRMRPEFTERTSTHVHMNIRDLTIDQIYNLTLLYITVERLLCRWVGHDRDKNIFCIPLNNTNYYNAINALRGYPKETIRNWQKYTAYNLAPAGSKGTVEFRHLYGTWNREVINTWISMLSLLKQKAKNVTTNDLTTTILQLNTNSFYYEYVRDIFKSYTPDLISPEEDLTDLLESSITYCKLILSY